MRRNSAIGEDSPSVGVNSKNKLKVTQNHFEQEVIKRVQCGHFSLSIIFPMVCIERTIN